MADPTVCAILLTADRPELARKAVESFRSQTYQSKRLLILDSGTDDTEFEEDDEISWITTHSHGPDGTPRTIGELRNEAVAFWGKFPIIVHWDDDDHSHSNRIAEQVALLQSAGADCVGYREMLFWRDESTKTGRTSGCQKCGSMPCVCPGEAWLYSNADPRYCVGTSLCYWRKTWERKPFEATSQGEDERFTTGLNCVGVSSLIMKPTGRFRLTDDVEVEADAAFRMIARIHAGNTSNAYDPAKMARLKEWRRVPEWDTYAHGIMEV